MILRSRTVVTPSGTRAATIHIESFHNTIGAAPEDLFEAAFGDHVQVVLTTKEITINDIDHETSFPQSPAAHPNPIPH